MSTAYYAVFQALCAACADRLVGAGRPWSVYTPVFRALDHYAATQALRDPFLASNADLRRLGLLLKELQKVREWADYNPEPSPDYRPGTNKSSYTRQEALSLIESAVDAVRIIDRLDDDERLKLATRLVPRSRKS